MKRIGLLGGMSAESSIEYERIMNSLVRERLGGNHSADLVIRSFDFAQIEALQVFGEWEAAGRLLVEAAQMLEAAGCELVILCTNTMHAVAPAIEAAISASFIHIADATGQRVEQLGISKVGLLGTRFTMEEPFYRERLAARYGLEVMVPNSAERELVHKIIYNELVRSEIVELSREHLLRICDRLVREGCQGIIAGCTELELLVGEDDLRVPLFPTARIHAQAAVEMALCQSA